MVDCIKCDSKIMTSSVFDECGGILVRLYYCDKCGVEFKRVFELFEEEIIE